MSTWLLDKRFVNRVRAKYENFDIRAGILVDGPHYRPAPKPRGKHLRLTTVDGMAARRKSRKEDGTIAQLSKSLRQRTGVNIFTSPFKLGNSLEIQKFKQAMRNLFVADRVGGLQAAAESKLVEALRAPIRQRRYGNNSILTARTKGFDRFLFDTGQLYKAIRARVRRLGGR